MNFEKGFKRLTFFLSFFAGPFVFLLFCIEVEGVGGALDFFDFLLGLLIFEAMGFVAVWIIYWVTRWIVIGFLDDKQKDQPYGERVINATKIFIISIVMLYVAIKLYDLYQRGQAALVNPDVTIAFEIINMRALLLEEQDLIDKAEYKQYKAVIENIDYPFGSMESRKAEYKYYDFLTRLGFKLPPYKLKKPVTQPHKTIFLQDYFQLVDATAMFHEGLTDVEEKELERIIEETSKRYSVNCYDSLKGYGD